MPNVPLLRRCRGSKEACLLKHGVTEALWVIVAAHRPCCVLGKTPCLSGGKDCAALLEAADAEAACGEGSL
jgi:hypothetical protein